MTIKTAVCLLILIIIIQSAYEGYKNGILGNHLLGALLGAVSSILKIWVVMDILIILSIYIPSIRSLNETLMESSLYALISSKNISAKFLGLI